MNEKQKYEKIILRISLYAGMAFVVVELLMSLWSNSQAILMDAVFDAAELIVIGLSLFLTPLFYQPVSEKKPYGYIFMALTVIFLLFGAYIVYTLIRDIRADRAEAAEEKKDDNI